MEDVYKAITVLQDYGTKKENLTILHCNTEYPTPMHDVNLKAMLTIRDVLKVNTGYSDHTLGIEVPIAAVAMGATVIEKHFTLDKTLPGPDHKASLEPSELKLMVKSIRNIEAATSGDGLKKPSESEIKNITIVRKSIHLLKALKAGDIINESDILALRPGGGISPMKWEDVIGKKIVKDTKAFDMLSWDNLKS